MVVPHGSVLLILVAVISLPTSIRGRSDHAKLGFWWQIWWQNRKLSDRIYELIS